MPGRVSALAGSAPATDDGSQWVNRQGRVQEPDRRGKYAVRFGDLWPRIIQVTLSQPEDDIDSSWNLFAPCSSWHTLTKLILFCRCTIVVEMLELGKARRKPRQKK